ncbi:GNAT family N-acetyltransferase [Streptomyces sp. NPDC059118]|uniref:GNAT family N-acetyltransferase n=1 Tax=unclassified Streptomyces TaxID=2593676 RepID=UPI00368C422E
MDLKWRRHADARDVRSLLLDVHDDVYADDPGPFHSRERFSYFVDLWSGREGWWCVSGWESGGPVEYAYGAKFKPGGWWKGAHRPRGVRGRIFALYEQMVVPRWQGTGRAQRIHDVLIQKRGQAPLAGFVPGRARCVADPAPGSERNPGRSRHLYIAFSI